MADTWPVPGYPVPGKGAGKLDPLSMLGGAPSFTGGAGGSARSEANQTSIFQNEFNFQPGGSDLKNLVPLIVIGGALWLVLKKK